MKQVIYSTQAQRKLARIPANEARRIRSKVQQYALDPRSLANNVKRLEGLNYLRLRVGDWRVIFREDGVIVDVVRIAARGEAYEGM
ncbi:type II toxin-antitoxin system RelE/ParE family toxin [Ciceribacter sp. L1K23]|uniref:type II toxin-antitoxin system RelE family toxin n=1 Tax=Ciceribacter sp. L1K23 TaxID=2820276 RepID=UPI001B813F95|nr:type II toxin-antitoxin system RelE/ParE family toxin [Ciceribacter sp. L1K23]MBR0554643.1 type II toxin-antitoxin system RelE/ParE family toxin [Ciceribacter sp. L1K23]